MRRLLAFLLLASAFGFGQGAYIKSVDTGTITTSGRAFTHQNVIGEVNVNVEYVISGSPTITSIVLQGCMRGNTCQTLNTYTSSSNGVVAVTGLYDSYVITPTWTGGSSPAVQINWLATANTSPSAVTLPPTYRAFVNGLSVAASATDVFTLTGNANTTVTVNELWVSCTATATGTIELLVIKRSTADTAGTSASVTAVPNDSQNPAAGATALSYTANPTTGNAVGTVLAYKHPCQAVGSGNYAVTRVRFNESGQGQPITLRGTAQQLVVNLNGATITGGGFDIGMSWNEQ